MRDQVNTDVTSTAVWLPPLGQPVRFDVVERICAGFNGNVDVQATLAALAGVEPSRLRLVLRWVLVGELVDHLADTVTERVSELAALERVGVWLPPIVLWRSFVVDGNHRVVVADRSGQGWILAFVLDDAAQSRSRSPGSSSCGSLSKSLSRSPSRSSGTSCGSSSRTAQLCRVPATSTAPVS